MTMSNGIAHVAGRNEKRVRHSAPNASPASTN
jgi:hypothetical protein